MQSLPSLLATVLMLSTSQAQQPSDRPTATPTKPALPHTLIIETGPRCPGRMAWTQMTGPTPMNHTLDPHAAWVHCLEEETAGATGADIADRVALALKRCGTHVPGQGDAAGSGLYAGESCANTRTTDVYYYITVAGSRALKWTGWHVWECDPAE